jgi:hypothetical protein
LNCTHAKQKSVRNNLLQVQTMQKTGLVASAKNETMQHNKVKKE